MFWLEVVMVWIIPYYPVFKAALICRFFGAGEGKSVFQAEKIMVFGVKVAGMGIS
jgi:hypothetical protein